MASDRRAGDDRYPERKAKALERLTEAVKQGSECLLSNVFYDAAQDGFTWGFDSDDLAAVLLPVLLDAFKTHDSDTLVPDPDAGE